MPIKKSGSRGRAVGGPVGVLLRLKGNAFVEFGEGKSTPISGKERMESAIRISCVHVSPERA